MYLFYTLRDGISGRVDAIYQDHEVSDKDKAKGVHYEGVLPEPLEAAEGEEAILFVNPAEGTVWYEGVAKNSGSDVADLQRRLYEAEDRLKNPDERYRDLNKTGASLAQLKAAKVEQLKYLSDQDTFAGFKSPSLGYTFGFTAADQDFITKQVVAFIANPAMTKCTWKTLDAGVVELTKEQFMTLIPEANDHTRKNIDRQWQLSQQVMAANAKEVVDAIIW